MKPFENCHDRFEADEWRMLMLDSRILFVRGGILPAICRVGQVSVPIPFGNTLSQGISNLPNKPIQDVILHFKLLLESKSFEINEAFSKASKELNVAIAKGDKFLAEEMARHEKAIVDISNKASDHGKVMKQCAGTNDEDVKKTQSKFRDALKVCNETTFKSLEVSRSQNEVAIEEAKKFSVHLKNIMKECLTKKTDLNKCLKDAGAETVERFHGVMKKLDAIPKDSEYTIAQIMKNATKCHKDAHAEAAKSFQKILADIKLCIDKEGKGEPTRAGLAVPATAIAIKKSVEESIVSLQSKIATVADNIKASDEGLQNEKIKKCVDKATMDTQVALDILQHDLARCTDLVMAAMRPLKSSHGVKDTFGRANFIVQDMDTMTKTCIGKNPDMSKCFSNHLWSQTNRGDEVTMTMEEIVSEAKLSGEDVGKVSTCYTKSLKTARTKITAIEKEFNECIEKAKNKPH